MSKVRIRNAGELGDLKPCPFCGCEELRIGVLEYIWCPECGGAGPMGTSDEEAREKWNGRAGEGNDERAG